MGWGYWPYPKVPVIDRYKLLTHGKFMTNDVTDGVSQDRSIAKLWLNGVGYETKMWGIWNGITNRDGVCIRRVAKC